MSKRDHDASGRPKLPTGNLMYSKTNTDMVSYEDLLIAQYMEELRKAKSQMKKTKDVPSSPYQQKLAHSDYGYRNRPMSATSGHSSHSGKPKIDAKFIADPSLWDPATPRSSVTDKRFQRRPISAPVKHHRRPVSGTSNMSWFYGRRVYTMAGRPSSAFTGRKIKSQYRKQPTTIRVTAFKNGSREVFCRLASPTVKIFLEMCTDKLSLPFAARRIFLEEGVEVFDAQDIPTDGEVYISTGENFKDPYANAKKNLIISQGAKWTLSGVFIPEEGHTRTRKSKMTKRMKALTEKRRVRIIVYRNGMSTEPVEVVADLSKVDDFLVACTGKLNLRSHAKIVFDWEGNEISHLTQTPVLDDCLQPGGTAILGPVWISVGESFSAIATLHYIQSIKQVLTDRLKDAERYRKEINYAMEGTKDKISITAILSMSEEELYNTLELAEKEIEQLNSTLENLKQKIQTIEELKIKEETEGPNYRMNHIQEFSMDHKLVGRKGLRLKVYENGCSGGDQDFYFNVAGALKGSSTNDINDKKRRLQRILDDLSTNRVMSNPVNPKLTPIAKRIFDRYGNEIKDILNLEWDQEIWVSFGEPFISPFTYCLQAVFDNVQGYSMEDKTVLIRSQLSAEELDDQKHHSAFDAVAGFPPDFNLRTPVMGEDVHVNDLSEVSGLNPASHYLQSKTRKRELVIYPELVINTKSKRGEGKFWPTDAQIWVISKKGYIYSKGMPQLCLAVTDTRVEFHISAKDDVSTGFVVALQKVTHGNIYQQWKFNPDATVASMAHPDLALTYTGFKFGDEEAYVQPEGIFPGQRIYLVVTDRLPAKVGSFQRFALKQERLDILGQWKHNDATNKEWNKLAYSWPVRENGSLNEDYDWPMEGSIIPNAPPLHKSSNKNSLSGMTPVRLMVLKNGERNKQKAVPVVGPNLTNFIKDTNRDDGKKTKKQKTQDTDATTAQEEVGHGKEELELKMFLDTCTAYLNLPFAGRRLFDSNGNEHFSLSRLKRDDYVYVSCGETWTDPKLSRAEQQRRFLLSQLSQDVAKIRQFCALRNPENYVLEIESNLNSNNRLIVNRQWKIGQEEEEPEKMIDTHSQHSHSHISEVKSSLDFDAREDALTAHQRAHERSEQRLNNLKWPWERLVNVGASSDLSDQEANRYTDKEMYERYKPAPTPRISRDTLQRFVYEDGYIACATNRNLVLGVTEQDGRVSPVMLVKRRPDDIHQRWLMKENGEIRSKCNQRLVLTVAMPANEPFAEDEEGRPLTFNGCSVTLQQRKNNQYGKAHQRWRYDAETGYIHSFETNQYDKEITAANKADVCTFSISSDTKIDQPGYMAEVPVTTPTDRQQIKQINICTSCARAMRGRYKLTKLDDKKEFKCAMGEAKRLKLQQIGSFRVLNGKVDLSTDEAKLTLEKWEYTLSNLREETSVRSIAKEISVAKTVRTVKFLAYKNGEGRLRPGKLICGSSIEGLLVQCTRRLGMTNAAKKIFTEDGTLILECEDLVDWAVAYYKSLMVKQLERLMSGQNANDQTVLEDVKDDGQKEEEPKPQDDEDDEDEDADNSLMAKLAAKKRQQQQQQHGLGNIPERGEGEGQDSTENLDDKESADVDQEESEKVARHQEKLLSEVSIPPIEDILRYPVEVWISSSKEFCPPDKVESKMENRMKKRAFRATVSLELDMEKHILRQMKARRYDDMNPGEYKSTRSSKQPVVIEGNWQEPTVEEQMKHDTVHKLETHLAEVKANQKEAKKSLNVNLQGRLYKQPNTKRLMVYPNGESLERATYVWGDSLDQILSGATLRLGLWAQGQILYNMEGKQVVDFDEIDRDELLCVSTGKPFVRPQGSKECVEVKANWSRARKQYGPMATDFVVEATTNPKVDVDPFGPPELALPPSKS